MRGADSRMPVEITCSVLTAVIKSGKDNESAVIKLFQETKISFGAFRYIFFFLQNFTSLNGTFNKLEQ